MNWSANVHHYGAGVRESSQSGHDLCVDYDRMWNVNSARSSRDMYGMLTRGVDTDRRMAYDFGRRHHQTTEVAEYNYYGEDDDEDYNDESVEVQFGLLQKPGRMGLSDVRETPFAKAMRMRQEWKPPTVVRAAKPVETIRDKLLKTTSLAQQFDLFGARPKWFQDRLDAEALAKRQADVAKVEGSDDFVRLGSVVSTDEVPSDSSSVVERSEVLDSGVFAETSVVDVELGDGTVVGADVVDHASSGQLKRGEADQVGYCYLRLVCEQYRDMAAEKFGYAPTIRQLLEMPHAWWHEGYVRKCGLRRASALDFHVTYVSSTRDSCYQVLCDIFGGGESILFRSLIQRALEFGDPNVLNGRVGFTAFGGEAYHSQVNATVYRDVLKFRGDWDEWMRITGALGGLADADLRYEACSAAGRSVLRRVRTEAVGMSIIIGAVESAMMRAAVSIDRDQAIADVAEALNPEFRIPLERFDNLLFALNDVDANILPNFVRVRMLDRPFGACEKGLEPGQVYLLSRLALRDDLDVVTLSDGWISYRFPSFMTAYRMKVPSGARVKCNGQSFVVRDKPLWINIVGDADVQVKSVAFVDVRKWPTRLIPEAFLIMSDVVRSVSQDDHMLAWIPIDAPVNVDTDKWDYVSGRRFELYWTWRD